MEKKKKQTIVNLTKKKESNHIDEILNKATEEIKGAKLTDKVSLDAQARLMEIMNDSPRLVNFIGTEWEVKALKPKVQALIAEEMVKCAKLEDKSMKDIFVSFTNNFDSVVKCIAYALLNDKERIKNEFESLCDTIKWESSIRDWAGLLVDIVEMLDTDFFFQTTDSLQTIRMSMTKRMMTSREQKRLLQERLLVK